MIQLMCAERTIPPKSFASQSWQSEGHVGSTARLFARLSSAGGDHNVLLSVHHVGHWCRKPREGQVRLPQQLSVAAVVGMEFGIENAGADEEQTAGSYDWAAIIVRSGIG